METIGTRHILDNARRGKVQSILTHLPPTFKDSIVIRVQFATISTGKVGKQYKYEWRDEIRKIPAPLTRQTAGGGRLQLVWSCDKKALMVRRSFPYLLFKNVGYVAILHFCWPCLLDSVTVRIHYMLWQKWFWSPEYTGDCSVMRGVTMQMR